MRLIRWRGRERGSAGVVVATLEAWRAGNLVMSRRPITGRRGARPLPGRVFLQPLGDREIRRLDDVAAVFLGGRLPAKEQIVNLVVDEVALALQVFLVDVESRRGAKEALELVDGHDRHHGFSSGV